MKVYDGASWITATSAGATSLIRFRYVATSGQATFSGADSASATLTYTVNNIVVMRNGVTLDTSEYTASNGTSIVLGVAAGTGDIVDIVAFKSFTVADALSAVSGGTVNGAVTITGVTTVQAGTASLPAITTSGDTNTGIFFPAADTIAFAEGGAEVARFNSSGNFGIGTTSPAQRLHVVGGQIQFNNGSDLYINPGASDVGFYSTGNVPTIFYTNSTERLRLNTSGTVILQGGSTSATGVGITFPATQSASTNANTLDDYEEGTWTPTLISTGGSAPAYTTQDGKYFKIGGIVYVFGTIAINGTLPGGNYTRIQGLPFGQTSTQSGVALKYSGATGVASGQFLTATIGSGEISFARNDGNGEIGAIGLQASYISTTFGAVFSTMYQVS